MIDPVILRAYRETEYRVYGDTPFSLRIGQPSAPLAALHRAHGVDCSAFVTACNPFSEQLPPATNAERQSTLAQILVARGLRYRDGIGQHPSGGWPGEPSFLVLGLSLDAARELGAQFGQNAIVWSGPDAVPQLVLLR